MMRALVSRIMTNALGRAALLMTTGMATVLVPTAVVTVTSTVPAPVAAGVDAVICVALSTL